MGIPSGYTSAQVVQAVPTGINSALVLINSTTFTTAASVSLPTNTFTATYDNYLVIIQTSAISTNMQITGRFRAAGTDNSSANYSNMSTKVNNVGGGGTVSDASVTSFNLGGAESTRAWQGSIQITTPFLSQISAVNFQMQCVDPGVSRQSLSGGGQIGVTTSFDSFTFICSTGTFTGTVRAYGYANS